jgi:hypothetical protein
MSTALVDSIWADELFSDEIFHNKVTLKKEWPSFFYDFIKQKRDRAISVTFMKRNPKVSLLSLLEQRKCYFGSHIMDTALAVKGVICDQLNPLWIPPEQLRAGETPGAVLDAIRNAIKEPSAYERAKAASRAKLARERNKGIPVDKTVVDAWVALKHRLFFEQMKNDDLWFPHYWICFTALSLPAGQRALPIFLKTEVIALDGETGAFENIKKAKKVGARAARKASARSVEGDVVAISSYGSSNIIDASIIDVSSGQASEAKPRGRKRRQEAGVGNSAAQKRRRGLKAQLEALQAALKAVTSEEMGVGNEEIVAELRNQIRAVVKNIIAKSQAPEDENKEANAQV